MLDSLIGVYITALYFLYFVVVKNTLAVFACSTNAQGITTMDAEPSIICDSSNSVYVTLRRWASLFVVVYGVGIPALFFFMLFWHRHGIKRDQELRKYGDGNTAARNPDIAIRRRYSKLYMVRGTARVHWCAGVWECGGGEGSGR